MLTLDEFLISNISQHNRLLIRQLQEIRDDIFLTLENFQYDPKLGLAIFQVQSCHVEAKIFFLEVEIETYKFPFYAPKVKFLPESDIPKNKFIKLDNSIKIDDRSWSAAMRLTHLIFTITSENMDE